MNKFNLFLRLFSKEKKQNSICPINNTIEEVFLNSGRVTPKNEKNIPLIEVHGYNEITPNGKLKKEQSNYTLN